MKKIIILFLLILPVLALAQESPAKKTAYFFYLDSCPHCHNVDNYFTANGVYEKYDIKKLDASVSANGKFMMDLYATNNYPEDQRGGVPVVAFGDKFLIGDKPIIDNFVQQIETTDNTDQMPKAPADIVVHDGPIPSPAAVSESTASGQNKKNVATVVIVAIVLLGAGALIYFNRK